MPTDRTRLEDRYRVGRVVGRGAASTVYRAEDLETGQPVAIKRVRLAGLEFGLRGRIEREVAVLSALDHPRVVRLLEHGATESTWELFLVFEWLEGRSLDQWAGPERRLEEVIEVGRQAAEGLFAAHTLGVVHRDVKPENLFLLEGPEVELKVLDFGVATGAPASGEPLTRVGALLGTPAYMAPEQATDASRVDLRADVFGLGIVLYELLTGELPWTASSDLARLARIMAEAAPPLASRVSGLPEGLSRLVDGMVARDPRARPKTMDEVSERLGAVLEELPGRTRMAALGPLRIALDPPTEPRAFDPEPSRIGQALASASLEAATSLDFSAGVAAIEPGAFEDDLATQAGADALPVPQLVSRPGFVRGVAAELEQALQRAEGAVLAVVGAAGEGKSEVRRQLEGHMKTPGGPHVWSGSVRPEEEAVAFGTVARILADLGRIGGDPEEARSALERLIPPPGRLSRLWSASSPSEDEEPALPEPGGAAARMLTPEKLAELAGGDEERADAIGEERRALVRALISELLRLPHAEIPPLRAARREARQFRARMSQAVESVLRGLSERRGLVILLDEAQHLDRASAEALAHLCRPSHRSAAACVMFGPEPLLHPELRSPLGEVAEVRPIPPLGPAVARALFERAAGREVVGAERLLERVGHNPLLLAQLGGLVALSGAAPVEEGRFVLSAEAAEALPATLPAALSLRIVELAPELLRGLTAAAIFESDFDLFGLEAVLGGPAPLDALLARDWVRRDGDRYQIAHPAVRTVALSRVPRRERREDEARLAAHFADRGAPAAVVARHLERAGRDREAARRLLEAAKESLHRGDAAGAIALAEVGLDRVEDAKLEPRLAEVAFEAALACGELEQAAAGLERWRLLETTAATEVAASSLARAQGRPAEALAAAERALSELAKPDPDGLERETDEELPARSPSHVRSVAELGYRAEAAAAVAAEALGRHGRAEAGYARLPVQVEPAAGLGLARIALARGELEAAAGLFARARTHARPLGASSTVVRALLGEAEVARRRGQIEAARASLAEAAEHARAPGDAARVRLGRTGLLIEEERYEDALVRLDWMDPEALPLDVRLLATVARGRCLRHHPKLDLEPARLERLRETLFHGVREARASLPALVPALESGLALCEWLLGNPTEAAERVERAHRRVEAIGGLPGDERAAFSWTRSRLLAASGADASEVAAAFAEALSAADAQLGASSPRERRACLDRPMFQALLDDARTHGAAARVDRATGRIEFGVE